MGACGGGGGRRAAGSAGWPEISPRSASFDFTLIPTSVPVRLLFENASVVDFQRIKCAKRARKREHLGRRELN